jgi:hypothetical protein
MMSHITDKGKSVRVKAHSTDTLEGTRIDLILAVRRIFEGFSDALQTLARAC